VENSAVIVAIVLAVGGAAYILNRLQRSARRTLPKGERPVAPPEVDARISASDARFRLLAFQGGSVPGDLQPIIDELRRNGIEVDEETLRRKLADGVAPLAEIGGRKVDLEEVRRRGRRATATLLSVTETPDGDVPPGLPWKPLVVELEHHLPDGAPVRVRRTTLIPTDKLELMVQGSEIPVRVDEKDPELLAIEWELT
jgi:hypothetical protein